MIFIIYTTTGLLDSGDVWIGLRPNLDGSGYHWLDGSDTTYLPWLDGEPDVSQIFMVSRCEIIHQQKIYCYKMIYTLLSI